MSDKKDDVHVSVEMIPMLTIHHGHTAANCPGVRQKGRSDGPVKVNSAAFSDGWDRIFGAKDHGKA